MLLNATGKNSVSLRDGACRPWQMGGTMAKRVIVAFAVSALALSSACGATSSGTDVCPGGNCENAGKNITGIASGGAHSCANVSGTVKCWGGNGFGQLGNGSTADSSVPVTVSGQFSLAQGITAGGNTTCAVTSGGAAKCWGGNHYGQLGTAGVVTGFGSYTSLPVQVDGLTVNVTSIATSQDYWHTCALVGQGVYCWGDNGAGQLGAPSTFFCAGNMPCNYTPYEVVGLDHQAQAISTGGTQSCAIVANGAWCWGPTPYRYPGWNFGVTGIAVGNAYVCALVNGGVECWGFNNHGQLGDGTTTDRMDQPVQVSGLTSGVTAIAAGTSHTCAIVNGGVKCWGFNQSGQLGTGVPQDPLLPNFSTLPVQVFGLTSGVTAIAPGGGHTCAIVNGGVMCWGSNLKKSSLLDPLVNLVPVPITGL
jgi:alpha-tubulin suppressor-like RCC1 family protein